MNADKRLHWLVRPATIKLLWIGGCALLALFTLAGLFVHGHAPIHLAETFGFNSWYGFAACAAMVIGAKVLGAVLKRKDDYYEH